ncbi:MAG: hypothetical protein HWN80_20155, partial [Candidatus Lokiarchaeota archaeon]|nr:hypothetical protein [Candidatus Lokiarchaeota archaeon]
MLELLTLKPEAFGLDISDLSLKIIQLKKTRNFFDLVSFGETEIKPGDEIIVHHNVFRRFYDVRGNEKNSRSYFEEDMYFVKPDQLYAYKPPGSIWQP